MTVFHGTQHGGFGRFSGDHSYFSTKEKDATEYAKKNIPQSQRLNKKFHGHGKPTVYEVEVETGRILDVNKKTHYSDFKKAFNKYLDSKFKKCRSFWRQRCWWI